MGSDSAAPRVSLNHWGGESMSVDANTLATDVCHGVEIESLQLDPAHLGVGEAATVRGTIVLTGAAPESGLGVELFTDQPEFVTVPAAVQIGAGTIAQPFEIN